MVGLEKTKDHLIPTQNHYSKLLKTLSNLDKIIKDNKRSHRRVWNLSQIPAFLLRLIPDTL